MAGSERIEAIKQLLRCYFDRDLDWSDVRDSTASMKTRRGESPSVRRKCPTCKGDGTIKPRILPVVCLLNSRMVMGLRIPCADCGGGVKIVKGKVKRVIGSGLVLVDDYTNRRVSTEAVTAPAPLIDVHCDACDGGVRAFKRCERCAGRGRILVPYYVLSRTKTPEIRSELTPFERARELRTRYHLPELERALRRMRNDHPAWYCALLISCERVRGNYLTANLDSAFEFLDRELPTPLRVPSYAREVERREKENKQNYGKGRHANPGQQKRRDEEIRYRYAIGEISPDDAPALYSITSSQFYRIVAKREQEAA